MVENIDDTEKMIVQKCDMDRNDFRLSSGDRKNQRSIGSKLNDGHAPSSSERGRGRHFVPS